MKIWDREDPSKKNSWTGALTFPRELFIRDGEIWQKPVDEIQLLRKKQLWNGPAVLGGGEGRGDIAKRVKGDCLEISFTLPVASSGVFKAYLRASVDLKERTVLSYDFAAREFTVDKTYSDKAALVRIPNESGEKNIPVHILVDKSSVEFFLCDGKYAVTNRIFPHPESVNYDFLCEGAGITLPDLEVYELS
jgi:sucrose-6-phosphate hydrolase SacC (GH32 family)